MKRLFTTAAAVASLLYLLVAYAPPAVSQIGYGAAPVASDILVGTADFTLQGDDLYVGWGASDDWQLEYVSASDQLRITDDGVAQSALFSIVAAGASGSMFDFVGTYPIADGADTLHFLDLSITNVDHTTGTAIVNGLNIGGITADAQADETAIFIGDGWDQNIKLAQASARIEIANTLTIDTGVAAGALGFGNGSVGFRFIHTPTVGANGVAFEVLANNPAQNGSDEYTALDVDVSVGNHTGTGNFVNMIRIDDLTGDANTNLNGILIGTLTGTAGAASEAEYAIKIESGWDSEIHMTDPSTPSIDITGAATLGITAAGTVFSSFSPANAASQVLLLVPPRRTGMNTIKASGGTGILDGSDEISVLFQEAYTDANHTGTGNILSLVNHGTVTSPDTNVIHTVINQTGDGYDATLIMDVTGTAWAAADDPPAGKVALFVQEGVNASADCELVARLSNGTEIVVASLVTNDVCP